MSENEPQAKKGMGGCLMTVIVVAVVLSIGIVVAIVVAVRSPTGQKLLTTMNQAKTTMERAAKAPGAAELKRSLCSDGAIIIDMDEMRSLGDAFGDKDNPFKQGAVNGARLQVICNPGSGSVPACAQVAAEYLKAVKDPGGAFIVNVSVRGAPKTGCTRLYSAAGEDISKGAATR